jgi:valyl-tRNA synthetase
MSSTREDALPKVYDPQAVEPKWYDVWEEAGYFRPQGNGKPFCIMIPPPNVTGHLHLGHALDNTLQDILIRWRRMEGDRVLWQPGTDHAGIATQKVVSDLIKKQEGKTRFDLGREAFLKRVWDWKEESGGQIVRQLKRLGASPDWSRERFTMDEGLSRAVRTAFVKLFERKLAQRDLALTNWCPGCQTVLSDLEVEHEEVPARNYNAAKPDFQKAGRIYHLRYPLEKKIGNVDHITVATTRPETMLGDTAVAVHPDDERYQALVKAGAKVKLPLTDRVIPIIADEYSDPTLGSGAVKITPAHDPNDFKVGQRHKLPQISVLDRDAKVNENGYAYQGLDRYEARKRILADLEKQGLLEKTLGHAMSVGRCQRSEDVVEPMISTQWFVRTKPLAAKAMAAVREKKTRIIPEQQEDEFFRWMEKITDWCISRQLWWGHQIPAWYCAKCDAAAIRKSPTGSFIDVAATPIVAMEKPASCPRCKGSELVQDPDVLDTWFSSGTWPFSTLGWPEKTKELEAFYPTSVLVTGRDILFFWVCRMMMFGLEFMDDVPFKTVYIHGLIRDEKGEKMSKTKGNVLDPLVLMDQFGTDALRFTIASIETPNASDLKLGPKMVEERRNFATKIASARTFLGLHLPEKVEKGPFGDSLADRWLLSRLQVVTGEVTRGLESSRFSDVARALQQFTWDEFCSWYLEMIRPAAEQKIAAPTARTALHVFESILRLLHPIMPFLTEELWQSLPIDRPTKHVIVAPFPKADEKRIDRTALTEMAFLQEAVTALRTVRAETSVKPGARLSVIAKGEPSKTAILERERKMLMDLASLESFTVQKGGEPPKGAAPPLAARVVRLKAQNR